MTFGEDAWRARTGAGPHVLSLLRNAAINVLNFAGLTSKAAALWRHAAHPEEALALITESGWKLKDPARRTGILDFKVAFPYTFRLVQLHRFAESRKDLLCR